MPLRIDHRETADRAVAEKPLAVLRLLLEQINVLRTLAGLPQITEAQAISRLKELLRG